MSVFSLETLSFMALLPMPVSPCTVRLNCEETLGHWYGFVQPCTHKLINVFLNLSMPLCTKYIGMVEPGI